MFLKLEVVWRVKGVAGVEEEDDVFELACCLGKLHVHPVHGLVVGHVEKGRRWSILNCRSVIIK